jgi:ribosome maturation factor RimP
MDLTKIREAAERVAHSLGLEVFDVEFKIGKDRLLRIYIDRLPGPENPQDLGVTHKDCENVSVQLSDILDVEELVPGPHYVLEVSSPGLDRKLLKPADYQRFAGRLAGYADGVVKFTVKDDEVSIPYAAIKKANLIVEL